MTCLFALIGFTIVGWITYHSFKKFASDGAQLAEEEDGTNSIMPVDDGVKNRVGKTLLRLTAPDRQ